MRSYSRCILLSTVDCGIFFKILFRAIISIIVHFISIIVEIARLSRRHGRTIGRVFDSNSKEKKAETLVNYHTHTGTQSAADV